MNNKIKIGIAILILLVTLGAFLIFGTNGVTEPSHHNTEWEVSINQQDTAVVGIEYEVPVEISNVGDSRGGYEVGLLVDGSEVDTKSVVLDSGESETVYLTTTFDERGGESVSVSQPDVEEEEWTNWFVNIQAGHLEITPDVMDDQVFIYETEEVITVGGYTEERNRVYGFFTPPQFEGTGTFTDGGTFQNWFIRGELYTEHPDGSITERESSIDEHIINYSALVSGFENPSLQSDSEETTYTTEVSSEENLDHIYNGTQPVLNTTYKETNVEGYQSATVEMTVDTTEYYVTDLTVDAETLDGESVTLEFEYNYDVDGLTVEPPDAE